MVLVFSALTLLRFVYLWAYCLWDRYPLLPSSYRLTLTGLPVMQEDFLCLSFENELLQDSLWFHSEVYQAPPPSLFLMFDVEGWGSLTQTWIGRDLLPDQSFLSGPSWLVLPGQLFLTWSFCLLPVCSGASYYRNPYPREQKDNHEWIHYLPSY